MKNGRIGVINIGATAFRMYIAEYSSGVQRELDFLIKPMSLGTDAFSQGFISLENVKRSVDILNQFKLKLAEYDVKAYKAFCTSGMRKAKNREFFLDYVHRNTGLALNFLDSTEEIYIKYLSAKHEVENFDKFERSGLIFANVSSGNITLNITHKQKYMYSGTLQCGSLQLRQMFVSISHLRRHKAIEEYVETTLKNAMSMLPSHVSLNHLVGAGSSINLLYRLYMPKNNIIYKDQLKETYEYAKTMSLNDIMDAFKLRNDEASVLVPTLIIYLKLLEITGASEFSFNMISFPETLSLYFMGMYTDVKVSKLKSTLSTVAQKYKCNLYHLRWVWNFAKQLFEELGELHSLGKEELQILEIAVMLNDVGRYMSDSNVSKNSYYIIKELNLLGMDLDIIKMAACVVYESSISVSEQLEEYRYFNTSQKLTISKLAGIHRVAKALDASSKRHIEKIDIGYSNNRVVIQAVADREPYLEMYEFDNQKQLFVDTFGVYVELRVRINYD